LQHRFLLAQFILLIQFCLKNDTKYLNFLLIRAYIDSVHRMFQRIAQVQYIRKAQLLVSNICQTNICHLMLTLRYRSYILFVSYILTSSTFRS